MKRLDEFPPTMNLYVTKSDIKIGQKHLGNRCRTCPIAQSAARHTDPVRERVEVRVSESGIRFYNPERGELWTLARYRLPAEALIFIKRADADLPVKPFRFVALRTE